MLPVIIRTHIPQVHERREIGHESLSARGGNLAVPLRPAHSFLLQAPEKGSNNVTATFEDTGHLSLLVYLIVLNTFLRAHCQVGPHDILTISGSHYAARSKGTRSDDSPASGVSLADSLATVTRLAS